MEISKSGPGTEATLRDDSDQRHVDATTATTGCIHRYAIKAPAAPLAHCTEEAFL